MGWPVLTAQFNIKMTFQFNVIPATEARPLWLALLPDKLVMTGNLVRYGWNIISDCQCSWSLFATCLDKFSLYDQQLKVCESQPQLYQCESVLLTPAAASEIRRDNY